MEFCKGRVSVKYKSGFKCSEKIHSTYFSVLNNMVTKNSGEKNLNSRYSKVNEFFFSLLF